MYHEGAVLDALESTPRWSVAYWADRKSGDGSGTLLSLRAGGKRHLVVVDDEFVTHLGRQYPRRELVDLLIQVQSLADHESLAQTSAKRTCDALLESWQESREDGAMRTWSFPRGAFVRWFHADQLHIEAGEGAPYDQPMPDDLMRILVDLGWNAPDGNFRNCWLQPGSQAELLKAAEVAVLTPLAAFGCQRLPALPPAA